MSFNHSHTSSCSFLGKYPHKRTIDGEKCTKKDNEITIDLLSYLRFPRLYLLFTTFLLFCLL